MGHFQPTSASAGSGFWQFSAWSSFPWASLKLKQRQLPIQRLIPILSMEATTVSDIITTATLTTATTARDLLRLSLLLMLTPTLKLTPGMDTMGTDMVLATIEDTMVDTMATPTTATMARGLLMPRLPPLLTPRPTPTWCMATTVLVVTTAATMVATLTTTTARSADAEPAADAKADPWYGYYDTTVTATHTTDMATATTGASKEGTSNPELTRMKCQHFDDDLPNVLNFREESKRTKQNILLLQTHCI